MAFDTLAERNHLIFASLSSAPIPAGDWQVLRSLQREAFREVVRQAMAGALESAVRVLQVEAQAETEGAARCARYRVEAVYVASSRSTRGFWSDYMTPGRVQTRGRLCLHPDAPRVVMMLIGRWIRQGTDPEPDAIDSVDVGPFLESLELLPLPGGIALQAVVQTESTE